MVKSKLLSASTLLSLAFFLFTVSPLSFAQEKTDLSQNWPILFEKNFQIEFRDQLFTFTLKELGVALDKKKSNPSITINKKQAESAFKSTLTSLQYTTNARFQIGPNSILAVIPEVDGVRIDFDAFSRDLEREIKNDLNKPIVLKFYRVAPLITQELLSEKYEEVAKLLQKKITLTYKDNNFEILPISKPEWFQIILRPSFFFEPWELEIALELSENDFSMFDAPWNNNPLVFYKADVQINATEFQKFIVEKLKPLIEIPTSDVSINYETDGTVKFEGTARNGRGIKEKILIKNLELAIKHQIAKFDIPVTTLKARVNADNALKEKGIKHLIAAGYSNFSGSPSGRVHNIKVGMSKYNGLLIAPGETFSFNENLGRVDANAGYLKELVINRGRTTPEYGGGVCQVSSTIYRAAFFGGLPITERRAHTFAVRYYAQPLGYGLDATIYLGGQDLEFTNDTPGHILIQTYVTGDDAYVKFYGTDDEREVISDGPYIANKKEPPPKIVEYTDQLAPGKSKKAENPIPGFDATWYRTVIKGNQHIKATFKSHYVPWAERILVGLEKKEETPPETSSKS